MIVIDTEISTLMSKLGISAARMQEYGTKSVDDIVEAEAAQGNQQAVDYASELFTNVDRLVEIFKLSKPENKFAILSEMNSAQLRQFLPLMEKEDLLQGLHYLTQDKILKLLEGVPPEQLVKTVFQMFSPEQVVQLMPEDQLDKFLTSTDIDKNKMLEHLKSIPPEYLAQMLENVKGEAVKNMQPANLIKQISELNPLEYKDAILSMQPVQKQQLVLSLGKEDEKLYQLFSPQAYTHMINNQKQKPEIIKAMSVLEPEEIIKMLEELPNDLLSIVITQIDAKDFADMLINQFPQILAEIIAS